MRIPGSEKAVPAFSQILPLLAGLILSGPVLAEPATDYEKGLAMYRDGDVVGSMAPLKSAADAGHAPAQALYGVILDSAELDDEAVVYLRKAVEQNDPEGQYALAKMYQTGEGVARDTAEAARLLRASAAAGHERAILVLALAYVSGNAALGADDPTQPEAAPLLLKAADLGEVSVIKALIKAYQEGGFGIQPDAAKAQEWTAKLAELQGADTKTKGRRN